MEFQTISNRSVWQVDYSRCKAYLPTLHDYLNDFGAVEIAMLSISGVCFIITLTIFLFSLRDIIANVPREFITNTIVMNVIYPIVAINSFISLFLSSATLLADTISCVAFSFSAYFLILLMTKYGQGDTNYIDGASDDSFRLRIIPCCCLFCFKPSQPTKRNMRMIRYFVMQTIVIVPMVMLVQNFMFQQSHELYHNTVFYFMPLSAVSVVLMGWAFNVYWTLLRKHVPSSYKLIQKFLCFKLTIVFLHFQPLVGELILLVSNFDCTIPITPKIYKNIIVQFLISIETVMLALWANRLYRTPTKMTTAPMIARKNQIPAIISKKEEFGSTI